MKNRKLDTMQYEEDKVGSAFDRASSDGLKHERWDNDDGGRKTRLNTVIRSHFNALFQSYLGSLTTADNTLTVKAYPVEIIGLRCYQCHVGAIMFYD